MDVLFYDRVGVQFGKELLISRADNAQAQSRGLHRRVDALM